MVEFLSGKFYAMACVSISSNSAGNVEIVRWG